MVSLIIGHKGSGKTTHLIDEVNKAMETSNGHVICVEKGRKLTYDINSQVRLVAADDYEISGYDSYYGFLAGMCAGDSDITDILGDGTLKIGGKDMDQLAEFLGRLNKLSESTGTKFTFTVSADDEELPAKVFENGQKI